MEFRKKCTYRNAQSKEIAFRKDIKGYEEYYPNIIQFSELIYCVELFSVLGVEFCNEGITPPILN